MRYVEQVKKPEKKILLGEHGITNVWRICRKYICADGYFT
jgi:hypothetical protein